MPTLQGKVALVTGSGRGIGQAIAKKFASEGARLVINDLDAAPAEETASAIRAAGGEAVVCAGSVTDPSFPDRWVKTALGAFGGIDIIVNNAGYTWDNVIQKMTDEQFDAIIDVHLKAPFRILRAASELIRSAAKAGVIGLTRALAKEWGRYRVNVNAVAFGLIETRLTSAPAHGGASIDVAGRKIAVGINPEAFANLAKIIPLGRAGTPEDAAGAVYMLCLPESNYITGECVTCGGGYKMS